MQYCHAGFVVRGLYVGYEAALKAAPQALLKGGYLLGGLIGGYDYLLAAGVEGIEGVEELLLGGVLAGDELHIVYHQHVHIAVLVAELGVGVVLNGLYELVGKGLAGDVGYAGGGVVLLYFIANGVHKVGLAKANVTVNVERVKCLRRLCRHGLCRGVGYIVAAAYYEGIEGEAGVQQGLAAALFFRHELLVLGALVAAYEHGPQAGA